MIAIIPSLNEIWRVKLSVLLVFIYLAYAYVLVFTWENKPFLFFWQDIDKQVFYSLNGSMAENGVLQVLWAITNSRVFDLVPAVLILSLYAKFIVADKKKYMADRIATGIFMAIYVVLCVQIAHIIFDINRQSPSLVLKPAYLLSELVPWARAKDMSANSFPGDHASVLLTVSWFIWFFAGWRYGIAACMVTLLAVVPRMASGAHWATDIIVGGGSVAIASVAIALSTPLYQIAHHYILAFVHLFIKPKKRKRGRPTKH